MGWGGGCAAERVKEIRDRAESTLIEMRQEDDTDGVVMLRQHSVRYLGIRDSKVASR